jgi:hypothetical protein
MVPTRCHLPARYLPDISAKGKFLTKEIGQMHWKEAIYKGIGKRPSSKDIGKRPSTKVLARGHLPKTLARGHLQSYW